MHGRPESKPTYSGRAIILGIYYCSMQSTHGGRCIHTYCAWWPYTCSSIFRSCMCSSISESERQGDLVQSSHVKQQQWEASSSSSACLHAMWQHSSLIRTCARARERPASLRAWSPAGARNPEKLTASYYWPAASVVVTSRRLQAALQLALPFDPLATNS